MALPLSESKPETNGDTVSIKFGGEFIRKSLPWILGAGIMGSGGYMKFQHDGEIAALKDGQARLEGKMDLIIDALDIQPAPRRDNGRR